MPKTYKILKQFDAVDLNVHEGVEIRYLKEDERLIEVPDQTEVLNKAIELLRLIAKKLETNYTILPFEGEIHRFLDSLK